MPRIDVNEVAEAAGSMYPSPFDEPCQARRTRRLGIAAGLTQFGVNLVTLPPGAWSSQGHWHAKEDEFVYIVAGELTLVEDDGESPLGPGDCAAWKAGVENGHHLINKSEADAVFIAIGTRDDADWGVYSDIDMRFNPSRYDAKGGPGGGFAHKDGTPY
jgi:uncharacterized cupin superfamily protein